MCVCIRLINSNINYFNILLKFFLITINEISEIFGYSTYLNVIDIYVYNF